MIPADAQTVPPLDRDGVRTVQVGTALWGAALVMLLPFYGWLAQSGRLWWIWVCCAGLGLGLIGIDICRQRRDSSSSKNAVAPVSPTSGGRRRR